MGHLLEHGKLCETSGLNYLAFLYKLKGNSFPLVFALRLNKNKAGHELVFKQIIQPNAHLFGLTTNIEVAVHKALNSSFPNSSIVA